MAEHFAPGDKLKEHVQVSVVLQHTERYVADVH